MDKIYRIKSTTGGLSVCLYQITAIRYTTDTDHLNVEIITDAAILDALMTPEELEALQLAWNAAL